MASPPTTAAQELPAAGPAERPCQTCGTTAVKTFQCIQCNSLHFCDDCWPQWVLHAPGSVGWGGKPHEKSDPALVRRLRRILEPEGGEAEHERRLRDDEDTTWFGVGRDGSGRPVFREHGRFAALMAAAAGAAGAAGAAAAAAGAGAGAGTEGGGGGDTRGAFGVAAAVEEQRFPQLVSFIGETGAGKSTLIKLLIETQGTPTTASHEGAAAAAAAAAGAAGSSEEHDLFYPSSPFSSVLRSPVASSGSNDRMPTTGDVHLYADPSSLRGPAPMLFADCEGLNGGEAVPLGLRHRAATAAAAAAAASPSSAAGGSIDHHHHHYYGERAGVVDSPVSAQQQQSEEAYKLFKSRNSSKRPLEWARTPQTRRREYAVANLYPRILYTFSDVVVFVTRNPRSFESTVLERLVAWGAAAVDKSLNQPALPHAVVVFNSTGEGVDGREWDSAEATRLLMRDVAGAVDRVPALAERARAWRRQRQRQGQRQGQGHEGGDDDDDQNDDQNDDDDNDDDDDDGENERQGFTTEDLLGCYYASVTVVRIPAMGSSSSSSSGGGGGGGSYARMEAQAAQLMAVLRRRCGESALAKRQARMLAGAERMQVYLQAAYDHFAADPRQPLDFVREALRHAGRGCARQGGH